jgi:hypothetical protein
MIDENLSLMRAHRNNISRYCKLLKTSLTLGTGRKAPCRGAIGSREDRCFDLPSRVQPAGFARNHRELVVLDVQSQRRHSCIDAVRASRRQTDAVPIGELVRGAPTGHHRMDGRSTWQASAEDASIRLTSAPCSNHSFDSMRSVITRRHSARFRRPPIPQRPSVTAARN